MSLVRSLLSLMVMVKLTVKNQRRSERNTHAMSKSPPPPVGFSIVMSTAAQVRKPSVEKKSNVQRSKPAKSTVKSAPVKSAPVSDHKTKKRKFDEIVSAEAEAQLLKDVGKRGTDYYFTLKTVNTHLEPIKKCLAHLDTTNAADCQAFVTVIQKHLDSIIKRVDRGFVETDFANTFSKVKYDM